MVYFFKCLECGKQIEEWHEGETARKRGQVGKAICRSCSRAAVFYFIGEDVMGATLVKDLLVRDGENLASAVADADRKAREFRQKATEFSAEADKWEQIASQLRAIEDLARRPAAEIKRPGARKPAAARKPHGYWWQQVEAALIRWHAANPTTGRGPTKKELAREIMTSNQDSSEAIIFHSIYNAIDTGKLLYRVDHLYFPDGRAGK